MAARERSRAQATEEAEQHVNVEKARETYAELLNKGFAHAPGEDDLADMDEEAEDDTFGDDESFRNGNFTNGENEDDDDF